MRNKPQVDPQNQTVGRHQIVALQIAALVYLYTIKPNSTTCTERMFSKSTMSIGDLAQDRLCD